MANVPPTQHGPSGSARPSRMEGTAVTEVAIVHPDGAGFPPDMRDYDFARDGLFPVGIIRQGAGAWLPLVVDETRTLMTMLDGGVEIVVLSAEAREVYFQALLKACERLFGEDWPGALHDILGINRRAVQRGRIATNLLPPRLLTALSYVASADDGEELAAALAALAKYDKRFDGDDERVRRYWSDALDVFYGGGDHEGIRSGKPEGP